MRKHVLHKENSLISEISLEVFLMLKISTYILCKTCIRMLEHENPS